MQPTDFDYDVRCLSEHTLLSIYQRTNALDTIKYNTIQYIKHNSTQVSNSYAFRHKVLSSESTVTKEYKPISLKMALRCRNV